MSVARAGGNLLGMAVISLYCLVVLPTNNDPEDMKVECRQNMFLNAKWRKHIGTLQKATAVLNIINAEKAAPEPEVTHVATPSEIKPPDSGKGQAPVGAVVTAIHVKVGDVVEPGKALVDIKDHRAKAPPAQPSKETIFSALDVDGSGELGKEELVEVLAAWGVPWREAERCFTDLDTNADGVW